MAKFNPTKLCECGCGQYISKEATRFIRGHNCRVEHPMERHKLSQTREHETWRNIKSRCTNKNNKSFKNYGGRGIKVCDLWTNNFEAFLKDMGKRPRGHSIDRTDNNGDYTPTNCRWATPREQHNNKRTNTLITAFGETKPLNKWATEKGLYMSTIMKRINLGWNPETALSIKPIIGRNQYSGHINLLNK